MENEESVEKMNMIDGHNLNVLSRLRSEHLRMYRVRKILLTLLGILFVSHMSN
jgi:hypothetical protein